MAAKRVQVSVDGGTVYRTIPGSSGEYSEELGTNNDTVFGQTFESMEVALGMWMVSANAYFKGISGYQATLFQQGTATTMTAQACTMLTSTSYQITDATRRIIDYFSAVTAAQPTDVTATISSIDYLNGIINFTSAPGGTVTVSGKYIPTVAVAKGRGFSISMNAGEIDDTDYATAQANGGWKTFDPGLRKVTLDVDGIYALTNGWKAAMIARAPLVIEIRPDNSANTLFRGYFKVNKRGQSGDVGALEEEKLSFNLWVPDGSLVVRPFGWYFTGSSALNLALQNIITAWQNETLLKVRYQHDNAIASSGHAGDAIVTEITLTNTIEGLNEFKLGFRGSGAPANV